MRQLRQTHNPKSTLYQVKHQDLPRLRESQRQTKTLYNRPDQQEQLHAHNRLATFKAT